MFDNDETLKQFRNVFGNEAADNVKARLEAAFVKSTKIADFCINSWKSMDFQEKQELLVGLVISAVAYGKSIDCPGDIMVQMFLKFLQESYQGEVKVMAVSQRDNQPSHDFEHFGDPVFDTGRPRSKREVN